MSSDSDAIKQALIKATGDIVAAYVTTHKIAVGDVYDVVDTVFNALEDVQSEYTQTQGAEPQVDIEASITPEYLICLEDGKKLKMLKRYLKTNFDMTPEEYRKRWNLPSDYPMVAPNYAKRRSQLAKDIGLGKQSIKQRKAAAFNKMKNNLPMGKGKLRIVRSTDIMTTRSS